MRFSCTDGQVSQWFGKNGSTYGIYDETFDVGISSLESQEVELLGIYEIGMLYVTGYDLSLTNNLLERRGDRTGGLCCVAEGLAGR